MVKDNTREIESLKHSDNPLWLVIYTDLITNLMIFFLISYCLTWFSQEQRDIAADSFNKTFGGKQVTLENAVVPDVTATKEEKEEEKEMEKEITKKFENVEINEERYKIPLASSILFDSGDSTLKPLAKKVLSDVAQTIRDTKHRIVVEGHTDDKPIKASRFPSNWELSAARAFSVIQFLIDHEKIEPKRLSALGYGIYRPVVPNTTEENRTKNRRIEINIVRLKEKVVDTSEENKVQPTNIP